MTNDLKQKLSSGEPLHWGILACGKISQDFVRALTFAEKQHKVVACATSDCPKRAQRFIDDLALPILQGAKAYGSYDELLRDGSVDVVYVAPLNSRHRELVLAALEAGKHVLCEKPMAVNVSGTKEMISKAKEKGLFLMEAFWSRYFPAYQHIRKAIQSKTFGEVLVAQANFGVHLPANRKDLEAGESPLYDIGCYAVMFALFAFQGHAVKKVCVCGDKDANGVDVWAKIDIDFDNGRHAQLYYTSEAFTPCWAFVSFEHGQMQLPEWFWCPTKLVELDVSNGEYNDDTPRKVIDFPLNDESVKHNFNFNRSSGLRYEADCVFECLKGGKTECNNMPHEDSVRIAEVLEECKRQLGVVFPQDKQ